MLCHRLELTVDLDPSWPKERIAELYRFLTLRLPLASHCTEGVMQGAGFNNQWLDSAPSTLRIHDAPYNVDVICRFGESPLDITRHPFRGGIRLYRPVMDLALIPLPTRMWVREASPCGCPWCAGADRYLDTLAVDCMPDQRPKDHDRAWLTHAPVYRRSRAQGVFTLEEPAELGTLTFADFYAATVDAQILKTSTGHYPLAHELCGIDWLWRNRELAKRASVELLRKDSPPLEPPTARSIGQPCRQSDSDMIVTLPKAFWTTLERKVRQCSCVDCRKGGDMKANALRVNMQRPTDAVDIAELTHEPIWDWR